VAVAADKRSQAFGSLNIAAQAMRSELQHAGGRMLRVSEAETLPRFQNSHGEPRAIGQLILLQQHLVAKRSGTQRSTQSEKNKVTEIGDDLETTRARNSDTVTNTHNWQTI